MVAFFVIVLFVPLVAAGVAFVLLKGISLKESGCIVLAQLVVAGSSALIVSCANTHDTEVWNGVVSSKRQVWVSCTHSYQCNCHQTCTGSGKNRSCTTTCDTCYEHSNDWDWNVYTSNGEVITIDRVDRRGSHEPSRFTAVKMGEPTSQKHSYVNYVKASPDSLFRHQGLVEKYSATIPAYPSNVYDYYRLDRFVTTSNVGFKERNDWNADLMHLNASLGAVKQVNIIIVVTRNMPRDWFYALEESWVGGKKNDAVLVVSVDESMKPQWAEVMAWTSNQMFKVKLRDDILALPTLDRKDTLNAVSTNVKATYQRKPMKDFEYLKSAIVPSTLQWILTLLIALLVAGGLVFFFANHDPFNDERSRYRYRY